MRVSGPTVRLVVLALVIGVCAWRRRSWSSVGSPATSRQAEADDVDCSQVKCIALTFDDGPSPYTDRLLQILKDNDAKATFFQIGNKVAANPAGAKRVVDAGMELGSHTWEHPNMTTIPPEDIPAQFSKASDAIEAATGQRPKLVRTAGGLINDAVLRGGQEAGPCRHQLGRHPFRLGQRLQHRRHPLHADEQIKPNSVVLFHDTYSSTVDLVDQFIPVLKANGYHLVTVSHMLGRRGRRAAATAAGKTARPSNDLLDIPAGEIPTLPNTPSPAPMPNFPITDIPGANSGGVNNGA